MTKLIPIAVVAFTLFGSIACRGRRTRTDDAPGADAGGAPPAEAVAARVTAADVADARKRSWIDGPLTGRDNNVAAFRKAQISRDEKTGFRVFVKNEFGFVCGLTFDDDGNPSEMAACKGDDGWHAKEARIKLTCDDGGPKGQNCHGKYTLLDGHGFADPAVIEVVRPAKGSP